MLNYSSLFNAFCNVPGEFEGSAGNLNALQIIIVNTLTG